MGIRAYYSSPVKEFLRESNDSVLGKLVGQHQHTTEVQQRYAWVEQLPVLKSALNHLDGHLFLELVIPRMGKRADALLVAGGIIFVVEFKIGATEHAMSALDQVEDYALDLKNFHEGSHLIPVVPLLVSSRASSAPNAATVFPANLVANPMTANALDLGQVIASVIAGREFPEIHLGEWMAAGYRPTPTIVEAARVLYATHQVEEIARSDAGAKNLRETTDSISAAIDEARRLKRKAICFVTGVPGSGKTLAGLNIATQRVEQHQDEHAVFLSGNGPLVDVLREALARDKAEREGVSKAAARREVRSFVQNIHHFRDEYVANTSAPAERVVVFDEAQRAWTRSQAAYFMQRKRGHANFDMSEPEFLISVMDRHQDWCTIICLIGGGQEINTGEAGLSEWMTALQQRFPNWYIHASPKIALSDYAPGVDVLDLFSSDRAQSDEHLHLAVSMRSFRAEALSDFIGFVLDGDEARARQAHDRISDTYPIFITRSLPAAKEWLRKQARGTERFGLVASSGAQRLRPVGIHMKSAVTPAIWFLNGPEDVRSAFYLEEVGSEFDVQGLEVDWAGVCWDGDLYHDGQRWIPQSFVGSGWRRVRKPEDQLYRKNAYRVILTRARQGMVVYVPLADSADRTRPAALYDGTYSYLKRCGIREIS